MAEISITVSQIEEGQVDEAINQLNGAAEDFRDEEGAIRFEGYVDRDNLIAIGVAEYESERKMKDVEARPSRREVVERVAAAPRNLDEDPDRDLKDPQRASGGIAQKRAQRHRDSRADPLMVLHCELVASWS